MSVSHLSNSAASIAEDLPTNATVPTADLLDYSNWSALVRQQMLKALQRRQQECS
ncbi:MAG: hypothetical protein ACPGVO_17135 [Spirulinaceae cyanobacterium]